MGIMYISINSFALFCFCRYVDDWGCRIYTTKIQLDHLLLATRINKSTHHSALTVMADTQPQSHDLFFDPTKYPDTTLKAFTEFSETFKLRYEAQFPDPPKVSLDSALQRWKLTNTTTEQPDDKPNLTQYDAIVADWQSKDKVKKFLGSLLPFVLILFNK